MRLITLKEIAAMEPGEVAPGFRAQIKEVKQQKAGQNEHGAWTIQSLTLMDSTAVIQVKLFDAPEYTAQWNGAWIVVESTLNDKGKLSGILVSTYRDKKEIHVKAKSGAVISQATDAAPAQPAAAEPAKMPPPQTQPAPAPAPNQTQQAPPPVQPAAAPVQQPPPKTNGAKPDDVRAQIAETKRRLGQAANGIILAYDAAIHIANEVMKKHSDVPAMFTPDILEKLAVHLSIALERGGLVHGLPAGPLEAWTKKASQPAADEGGGQP